MVLGFPATQAVGENLECAVTLTCEVDRIKVERVNGKAMRGVQKLQPAVASRPAANIRVGCAESQKRWSQNGKKIPWPLLQG